MEGSSGGTLRARARASAYASAGAAGRAQGRCGCAELNDELLTPESLLFSEAHGSPPAINLTTFNLWSDSHVSSLAPPGSPPVRFTVLSPTVPGYRSILSHSTSSGARRRMERLVWGTGSGGLWDGSSVLWTRGDVRTLTPPTPTPAS